MRPILISLCLFSAIILQGCSDKSASTPRSESDKVTQTRMNDIDSLEGTISDEMIITDDANDEAAFEQQAPATSPVTSKLGVAPDGPKAAPAADKSATGASEISAVSE